MADAVLKVNNLIKMYGSTLAVDNISFEVPRGKIIGFLGPNGAGKTTTIQILLGITLPTSAKIEYFGKDFFTHRSWCLQRINFASAFNTLQGRISVYENLVVYSYLYGLHNPSKKILELLEYFEIPHLKDLKYQDLSTGQKTRVNFVKSLLNDPELILLDEPTASLDPDIADKTLSLIEKLKHDKKISMLYTSHDMEEITRICDEVIFLQQGKIVAQDTPIGLTKRIPGATLRLTFDGDKNLVTKYLTEQKLKFNLIDNYLVSIETEEKLIPRTILGLSKTKIEITDIDVRKPTLEDVFLQIARNN